MYSVGSTTIEQMVRRAGALGGAGLGGADVELAIHGDRVAVDDLAVELLSERQRQRRFSAGRGPEDDHQQRLGAPSRAAWEPRSAQAPVDVMPVANQREDQQQKRDQQQSCGFRRVDRVAVVLVRIVLWLWQRARGYCSAAAQV